MEKWTTLVEIIVPVGLTIAAVCLWWYLQCCKRPINSSVDHTEFDPPPTYPFEFREDEDEHPEIVSSTAASDPRMQLYQAYRSSSSIDISSLSLAPVAPASTTGSQVSHIGNSSSNSPYIVGANDHYDDRDNNNNNNNDSDNDNAGRDVLSSLPEVIVDEEKRNLPGGSDQKECSICLQEYEAGEKIKWLPCMHSFHQTCVATWFRQSVVCPLCKFPL